MSPHHTGKLVWVILKILWGLPNRVSHFGFLTTLCVPLEQQSMNQKLQGLSRRYCSAMCMAECSYTTHSY